MRLDLFQHILRERRIALLYLDAPFPEDVLEQVRAHTAIDSAKRLQFDINGN